MDNASFKESPTGGMRLVAAVIASIFLATGCVSAEKENGAESGPTARQMAMPEMTPFEKAKEIKTEYPYLSYTETMEELRESFPGKDGLLSDAEKNRLFPELMIGKSFSCRGTQTASFFQKGFETKEIEGKLEKSTESVSLKIKDSNSISFMTAALVKAGSTEGEEWKIIENDVYTLIAEYNDGNVVSALTISKKSGFGIWQKTVASGMPMTYEIPYGFITYLQCYLGGG